jgi:hypothetical protein
VVEETPSCHLRIDFYRAGQNATLEEIATFCHAINFGNGIQNLVKKLFDGDINMT